jgi:hypothetical protein
MTNYSKSYTMPFDFPAEDFCDSFNELTDGQVVASWNEADDGSITLEIFGTTEADEYTNDSTCDLIDEMIEKVEQDALGLGDNFAVVVLGGYTAPQGWDSV